jgi:hypothetical protein
MSLKMSQTIGERDWKIFRRLQGIALERFCQRVLSEIEALASNAESGSHERYLAVYELIMRRDKELAAAFNTPRRSAAFQQLASIQAHGLLSEEEMSSFSSETRATVRNLLEIFGH